ncbi:MAG: class I SAM-dependent methyltransferase [Nocardioidaceae bacterium]
MDERTRRELGGVFGSVADVYDRNRPGYPDPAVEWLLGSAPLDVLELGAGTGKLTRSLVTPGHRVTASDPAGAMLSHVSRHAPSARLVRTRAEQLPFRAQSFDAVVVAQAFHWFDHEIALPEIARVLRPAGTLALVWNMRDESVPWVHRLTTILGEEPFGSEIEEDVYRASASGLFGAPESKRFRFWQHLDRPGLLGLVASRSYVAAMDTAARDRLLARVGALYDEYERGPDGMRLPYLAHCFRTRKAADAAGETEPPGGGDLLFDFR